jgi:hypothetical protein
MPSVHRDPNYQWMRGYSFVLLATAVTTALGQELKLARESRNLSPLKLAVRVPTTLGLDELATYEGGLAEIEVVRLLEVCMTLDTAMLPFLTATFRRARVLLRNPSQLRADAVSMREQSTKLPREPAVQLAQAHRLVGNYQQLNEQLHKAQRLLAEQIARTAQAEADAASARDSAALSEWVRVRDRTAATAELERVRREHADEVLMLKAEHREALLRTQKRHVIFVAELLNRNGELLAMLAAQRVRHARALAGKASAATRAMRAERSTTPRPMTGGQRRQQRYIQLELAADADPLAVAIYQRLHPVQRRLLRALASCRSFGEFVRYVGPGDPWLRDEVDEIGRLFCEPTYVGLAALARELFTERPESVEAEGN